MEHLHVEFGRRIAAYPVFCRYDPNSWQPPVALVIRRVRLVSINLLMKKARMFTSNRCAPSWAVLCGLSDSSSALDRYRSLCQSKVYSLSNAVLALAITFSQAAYAITTFARRNASCNLLLQQCAVSVNDLLTGFSNRSMKILRKKWLVTARNHVTCAEGARECKNEPRNSVIQQGGLSMALLSTTAMAKDRISPAVATLCANPTFMSGLVAWMVAQVLKVFTTFFVEKRWDLKMLVGSGGMPSSHSALCVALTTSVAVCHGLSDALFPVCLGFSLIVMYDATGVRRHAGMQAEVLNVIVDDLFQGHPVSAKKLKELLGHTPLQVGAGAFVGLVAGYLCSNGYSTFSGHGF